MRTYFECVGCLVKQAIEIAQTNLKEDTREGFIREVLRQLSTFDYSNPPPIMALEMYGKIRQMAKINDPYAQIKRFYNNKALSLYPELKNLVKSSDDPLDTAMRIAVAGNIIDFGSGNKKDIAVEEVIQNALNAPFTIDDRGWLKETLKDASSILYLGDNAGEIGFDKIFIEELDPSRVTFATRDEPIINDATIKDAEEVGLTDICRVISSGSKAPGTPLGICTQEFRDLFYSSDLVISKGQGNFETLSAPPREVFFLLMIKCPVIAREIGAPVGSFIAMKQGGFKTKE
ncbi:MAG: DUF89 family protein [Deltaproteobacteria bacterium]|nr:DUF89 family protein [Deltaproteobacteria bacterium]